MLLTGLAVFSCVNAQQADELARKLLTNCKNELTEIAKKNVVINDITFNSDGHWLIIYGDYGYSFSFLPVEVEQTIEELNSNKTKIINCNLMSDTSWVVIYNNYQYKQHGYPQAAIKDLDRVAQQKKTINFSTCANSGKRLTSFSESGVIVYDIPAKAKEKIAQLNKERVKIKDAAFCNNNGWILLYGNRGAAFQNLPEDLSAFLKNSLQSGTTINLVRFYKDIWFVVYDGGKIKSNI